MSAPQNKLQNFFHISNVGHATPLIKVFQLRCYRQSNPLGMLSESDLGTLSMYTVQMF